MSVASMSAVCWIVLVDWFERLTGFRENQARRQLAEERQHLRSPQRFAHYDLARIIDRVNLKNALGQIEADGGWLPSLWCF
jgi:hypothetical protein